MRKLASRLERDGFSLHEDPFDVLAVSALEAFLIEVKTLDGSSADERDRVRDALSQLLYYEAFVTEPHTNGSRVIKIACFESKPSDAHLSWLRSCDITSIWEEHDIFYTDDFEPSWMK